MTLPNRESTRWKTWNYAQDGAYYVTVCTAQRSHLFGEVRDGSMRLNEFGRIVEAQWLRSPELRPEITLDEWVIMPNHLHAILFIGLPMQGIPATTVAASDSRVPANEDSGAADVHLGRWTTAAAPQSPSRTLGALLRGFKGAVTAEINALRNTPGMPVWQRNYHDRVIRNDTALERIRDYIRRNPEQWVFDAENRVPR
jgi:putative transposase